MTEHLAALVEQAGDAGALHALEIVPDRALAFGREQLSEIALHQFGPVMAEQRFGAAVGRIEVALGIEHHDAFGCGVENGAEFLGIGVADGRRAGNDRGLEGLKGQRSARPSQRRPPCLPHRRLKKSAPARNHRPRKSYRDAPAPPRPARVRLKPVWPKSSPACRCPRCCWHSRRRVRHRARRDRRLPRGREGSHSPFVRGTPRWRKATGRAGRSARRPEPDRAAPCRAGFRRAPAPRDEPAIAVAPGPRAPQVPRADRRWPLTCRIKRVPRPRRSSRCRAGLTVAGRARRRRCSPPGSASAISFRRPGGTAARSSACPRTLDWAFRWEVPRTFPNRLGVKSRTPSQWMDRECWMTQRWMR